VSPRAADTAAGLAEAAQLVDQVERAIEAEDRSRAGQLWNAAYAAAVRSRRWEPMVALGDAALRLDLAAGVPGGYRAAARQVYLSALVRVRILRSTDGLCRIANAFDRMGDPEMARRVRRVIPHMS
jgi:hypothetical protein